MKKVVILGGGFGGVACALELIKLSSGLESEHELELTLVNDHEYHTLNFALYQAATNEEPSRDVAIPLTTIFDRRPVKIHIGRVERIIAGENKILLKNGQELGYDFLVLAVGSQTADFGIPGVKENALTLKTLYDAAILRNRVKLLFEDACNNRITPLPLKFLIGGGGFSGTELAGELHHYGDTLAKQFNLPKNCFEVSVIQSGDQLLNGLDKETGIKAKSRLEKLHVKVLLGSHITKVEKNEVALENGQTLPFNLLVWTVGIKGNSLLEKSGLPVNKSGKVAVNEFLQIPEYPNIFVCGDCAAFSIDIENRPAPAVAPVAIDQGKLIAKNIYLTLQPQSSNLTPYHYRHHGYIVPISGRYALARLDFFKADGLVAFILQQLNVLRYLLSILPLSKAFRRWNTFEMELVNED